MEKLKNKRIIRKVYYLIRGFLLHNRLAKIADNTLNQFGIIFSSDDEKRKQIEDMVRMERKYGFTPSEYLNYRFKDKTEKARLDFVADWVHLGYACALNDPKNNLLFDNKWLTYNRFKKYYKRELLLCDDNTSFSTFLSFIRKNKVFFCKPVSLSCGKGARIINVSNYPDSKKLYTDLLENYNHQLLMEELIVQSPLLAKFHPNSVNTLRIPTIRLDNGVSIVHPQLRMGQHGSIVDNAGAGGIKGAIDPDTGVILSAVDNLGHVFSIHPDSGVKIVGTQIPYWEDAKKLVIELAYVVPENRYTGWDLALTDNGWIMVEANRRAQFGFQMSLQKGFRQEINGFLEAINTKY